MAFLINGFGDWFVFSLKALRHEDFAVLGQFCA